MTECYLNTCQNERSLDHRPRRTKRLSISDYQGIVLDQKESESNKKQKKSKLKKNERKYEIEVLNTLLFGSVNQKHDGSNDELCEVCLFGSLLAATFFGTGCFIFLIFISPVLFSNGYGTGVLIGSLF